MLGEWTARAQLCDMLNETVISSETSDFNVDFIFLVLFANFTCFLWIKVRVAMVGKYTGLSDSYLSVLKVILYSHKLLNFE